MTFAQLADILTLLLQLEGVVVALVGAVKGATFVKLYSESKARSTLHSAIENGIGYARAQTGDTTVTTEAAVDIALSYIKTSAKDSIETLFSSRLSAANVEAKLKSMIAAKAQR